MRHQANLACRLLAGLGIVVQARQEDVHALRPDLIRKLLSPLDGAHAVRAKHVKQAGVLQLVGVVKTVEVKVVERQAATLVDHLDGEGGARHVIRDAKAGGHALGELRLSGSQVTRQHQHISLGKALAQSAAHGHRLGLRARHHAELVGRPAHRGHFLPGVAFTHVRPPWRGVP